MGDIFFSYTHGDRERIRPVVAQLETQGWSVWWDRRVRPGQRWEDLLINELKNCRAVVVFWTQSSVRSMWVELEASAGLEIDGLVPIQLDPFDIAPIPNKFKHIHAADLTTWSGGLNPGFELALQALREIISRPATAPSLAKNTGLKTSLSLLLDGDLGSSDPHDRQYIHGNVKALKRKAVPALLAALQFPEPDRRGHAAHLLGVTGDPMVVSSLAPLLADYSEMSMPGCTTVREAAAYALKTIGTREALRVLADGYE
jgi:TIR domain